MSKTHIGYLVWGTVTLVVAVLELMPVFDMSTPFPTLSTTVTSLMRDHPWFTMLVAASLFCLAVHWIFWPWPSRVKP